VGSRSRSRSSSILRRIKGSKKKDAVPATLRRDKSRDHDDDRSVASRKIVKNRRDKSRDHDDDRSLASRKSVKSTRSRAVKSGKKKSGQSLSKSQSKASPPEIASPNSGSGSIGKDDKKKSKKKSKKIKRIRKSGSEGTDSGEDDYTVVSVKSTKSNKSNKSSKSSGSLRSKVSKASRYSKTAKNRVVKQYKETTSRVEAIREPILSTEGVMLKDELDNLFPLPMSPGSKLGKATRSTSSGKKNGVESSLNSDADDGLSRSSHKPKPQSQRNIMTNKAAEEQAEAALNRVAAHQQTEMNTNNDSGSFAPGEHRQFGRRFSNGSTRSRDQYQRLQRDSGKSVTNSNDHDDDARSFSSRRSQSNLTAMSALHKRMDEYKVETENLQKRLYEALAEVEQSNIILRRQKERADKAEGDLCEVKEDLECVEDEKSFLVESIRDMETEFSTKDKRVEKLQEVAETQLDTVEFLEDKLNKTEEEFLLMEDEMNELILVVEEKNKTEEQINEVKSKGQGRVARMTSMREEMDSRKRSIRTQKEESRRVLLLDPSKSADRSRAKSVMTTPDENQDDKMKTRDDDLKAKERRLDKWERDLFDLEDQLKKGSSKISGADNGKSQNSENEALIASLEEEKETLRRNQIDSKSKLKKLEFDNEDLRLKLDRFTKMMTDSSKGFPAKNGDLSDALSLVDEKNKVIKNMEHEIKTLSKKATNNKDDEEGKDMLIRELQNQLVNSKKEASSLSSGTYVTRLKIEIKKLRGSVLDLKKKVKEAQAAARSNLQKKDDSMKLLEKQMQKLKIELERREKRENNLGAGKMLSNSDLQNHIEDLEDEISHWKSTNADLENELEVLKLKVHDPSEYLDSDEDADDDDCSIGSLASVNSRMSLCVSHEDNFFLADSNHSNCSASDEAGTPTRAMRAVNNIWSKMRNGPEPPHANQAFPYGPGSLNDYD